MKLELKDLTKLDFGQKFYRVVNRANGIDSLIYCGLHPYNKGKYGIIAHYNYDVSKLIFINLENPFGNCTYFDNYDESKKKFIEEAERNLESIKAIYGT